MYLYTLVLATVLGVTPADWSILPTAEAAAAPAAAVPGQTSPFFGARTAAAAAQGQTPAEQSSGKWGPSPWATDSQSATPQRSRIPRFAPDDFTMYSGICLVQFVDRRQPPVLESVMDELRAGGHKVAIAEVDIDFRGLQYRSRLFEYYKPPSLPYFVVLRDKRVVGMVDAKDATVWNLVDLLRKAKDPMAATTGEGQVRLVKFFATWCGPCTRMTPIVDRVKEAGWPVDAVDIDTETGKRLCARFNVTGVPTCVIFYKSASDGKYREFDRVVGMTTYERLTQLLQAALATKQPVQQQQATTLQPTVTRYVTPTYVFPAGSPRVGWGGFGGSCATGACGR